jgi:4-carboxymuconolactone decarboxylase
MERRVMSRHQLLAKDTNMTDRKHLPKGALTYDEVRSVSPALEHYTEKALLTDLWSRPELSRRDRSLVTVAALIARIQTIEMPFHFAFALDNGITPAVLSETITHLKSPIISAAL